MRRLLFMVWAWLCFCKVQSKAVFAHFMVGNVGYFAPEDWANEIVTAANLGIDAFALNMAHGDDTVQASISNAFQGLELSGKGDFKLFFSFDYAGGGPWPAADVSSYLGQYVANSGYYHTDGGQPFVSTFEGPANAKDWVALKAQYNVFFMPDWSSLGAGPAWDLGVADGLFSWAAWPWGNHDSDTWVDASYLQVLKDGGETGAPYMMGVSPMFYTNLPFYDKNWAWRGDRLWFDRWKEVLFLQPDYVEIITWNDWGESHYIASIDPTQVESVLGLGKAPFDYVSSMDHDGWTYLLPAFISLYKTGEASTPSETIVAWGRSTSTNVDCSTNGTTVNTASQLQLEFPPNQALSDNIFFTVIAFGEVDDPVVTVGGTQVPAGFSDSIGSVSSGGAILFGNASFIGHTGDVHINIKRYGSDLLSTVGTISDKCTNGYINYNMWTTYSLELIDGDPGTLSVKDYVCTAGTSVEGFSDLCEYTCALGYCPYTACLCTAIGPQPDLPEADATQCYPLASASVVYEGICHFACTYGYLDILHCGTDEVSVPIPTVSPFTHDAATAGTGLADNDVFNDLCKFTCQYGYCPLAACTVTDSGDLVLFTGEVDGGSANFTSEPWNKALDDLCTFSCNRGHCPDACTSNLGCTSGSGDGNYGGLCSFSCGYGFCPEPCTCLSNGTLSTPPTFDPTIGGYADTGLDANTYDPLCNFTCSHGYCPSPNACLSSITINPDEENTIPTLPAFDNDPVNATYSPGDFFTYVSEENPDLSLDVILLDSTDLGDVKCDDVVSGENGATLGCVGETVEFLMLSLLNDQYALSSTKRDIEPRINYKFATHSLWKASGNCTTRYCMLAEGAPLQTWTSVGNGSYNGVPYELHFINTGSNHGFSARRGLPSNSTSTTDMERRQAVQGHLPNGHIYFRPYTYKPLSDWDAIEFGKFDQPLIDLTTDAAMESAKQGYTITCNSWKDNSTAILNNSDSIIEGVMDISIPTVGTAVAVSSADIDRYVSSCTTEEDKPHTFVIYPHDGNQVDTLSELLASFQNINLETVTSISGYGVIFWKADLTPPQWKMVTQNKQCYAAPAKCQGDACIDPANDPVEVDGSATYNATAWLTKDTDTAPFSAKLSERDGPIATQSDAPADLWFISQPPGTDPLVVSGTGTYTYDSTGGENVVVYILDSGRFDMTLPEFTKWALVPGTIQVVPSITPKVFGTSGWNPPYNADGTSHGTGMLAALAGATKGVAKSITPVPISFDWQDGAHTILTSLDWILSDWLIRRANAAVSGSGLAPLAVLSMSFGYARSDEWDAVAFLAARRLTDLVDDGILPVAAAGNTGGPVEEFPARFADESNVLEFVESLLAVGSVGNTGYQSTFSSYADFVQVSAPGENIASPYWTGVAQDFKDKSGTSPAAAKVAGLAAYLIGLQSKRALYTNPKAVADDIEKLSWARQGRAAIYNGIVLTG